MARHPILAHLYGRLPMGERAGVGAHRDELLAGLAGRILEVGAGSGLCFGHYPAGVTDVVAEPEPHLRRLAAAMAPVPIQVLMSTAAPNGCPSIMGLSTPWWQASFVLCSVPDPQTALAEMYRVLRPGGQLHFYEHVRADGPRNARLQDRVEWVWPHLLGGCHANRDTPNAVTAPGFRIEACRRFEFRLSPLDAPASPHLIGTAVRS